jgi:hypothetical protein
MGDAGFGPANVQPWQSAKKDVMHVVDADQHIFEQADMWRRYVDPGKRHLALSIEPDELGYWWVTSPLLGRRIWYANITAPGDDLVSLGGPRKRMLEGLPSQVDYPRDLPTHYWDATARCTKLDEFGIDRAFLIPNYALEWVKGVADRPDLVRANMEAWNRRAVELSRDGQGRLYPVGHVTLGLDEPDWLERQLSHLSDGGVKAAMLNYGLVDGRRLSHQSLDAAWAAFVAHDIVPVFHVLSETPSNFSAAWFDGDDPQISLLENPFFFLGVQLAIADLALNGVLQRHPELRFCVVELFGNWLVDLLPKLDASYELDVKLNGRRHCPLDLRPSEYVVRQLRLTTHWSLDDTHMLLNHYGNIFMFGSDYPHSEGLSNPLGDFQSALGSLPAQHEEAFYGGTFASLIA